MLEAAFTCVMRLRPPLPLIRTLLTTYSPPVPFWKPVCSDLPRSHLALSRSLSLSLSLPPSARAHINLQLLITLRWLVFQRKDHRRLSALLNKKVFNGFIREKCGRNIQQRDLNAQKWERIWHSASLLCSPMQQLLFYYAVMTQSV